MSNDIIFLLISLAWIVFAAWYDYDEIKAGKRPIHTLESFWQFLFIGTLATMFFYGNWPHVISMVLYYIVLRIILYSPVLNLFRGKGLSYIGEDLPASSLEDRFYHWVNKITHSTRTDTSIWQWPIKALLIYGIYLINILITNYL